MEAVGLSPPRRRASIFSWLVLWASIQFEFTHINWNNWQMGFANVKSDNILRSNNHRYNYKIENFYEPCVTFSGIKENNYDSSTFVNISLHLSSDSTTLVYICLWLKRIVYAKQSLKKQNTKKSKKLFYQMKQKKNSTST